MIRGANGRVRYQRVRACHRVRRGVLAKPAIGFVPDDPRHAVAVPEPRPGVHPVPTARDDVWDVGSIVPRHLARVLDTHQRLLRTVEWRFTPLDGFQAQVADRVENGIPVTDHYTVRHPAARRLEPHLPANIVSAEKGEIDPRVSSGEEGVIHGLRPVLVVAG